MFKLINSEQKCCVQIGTGSTQIGTGIGIGARSRLRGRRQQTESNQLIGMEYIVLYTYSAADNPHTL
jgi:hypothetical protein